jgi:DNA-binding protein YbaB
MGEPASEAYTKQAKKNDPTTEVLTVTFNGNGDAVSVKASHRIAAEEPKDMIEHGVLASVNWCRWVLRDGEWV